MAGAPYSNDRNIDISQVRKILKFGGFDRFDQQVPNFGGRVSYTVCVVKCIVIKESAFVKNDRVVEYGHDPVANILGHETQCTCHGA
jgi:hypothetical protein